MKFEWEKLTPETRQTYLLLDCANALLSNNKFFMSQEIKEDVQQHLGPFSLEFLERMEERRSRGLRRIRVSIGPNATPEGVAREWLACEWAIERGYITRMRHAPDRRFYPRDWLSSLWCSIWVWFDKKILRTRNPYEQSVQD